MGEITAEHFTARAAFLAMIKAWPKMDRQDAEHVDFITLPLPKEPSNG